MYYQLLIVRSKARLQDQSADVVLSPNVFADGAGWMRQQIILLTGKEAGTSATHCYTYYGLLKYGICVGLFLISAYGLFKIHPTLVALSVFVFYWAEVHFLFLFPLLVDGVKNPLLTSIKATYMIGIWRAITTVMPIGLYMLSGLFNRRDPFKKWHIGCLCIIIWYNDKVRSRV